MIGARLRRLAARDWLLLVGTVLAGAVIGIASYVVIDAARVRAQAVEQAQAQRDQAIDSRQAQSRRIDQLTDQVERLRDDAAVQARTIGRQEQAIRDLSAQVRDSGQAPVVTSVAPRRTATRTPTPQPGRKPTSRSSTRPTTAPTPVPRPAPTSSSPGLICGLLIIVC